MNHIGPLLTRENLLFYCKDSAEELQKEKRILKRLERALDQRKQWSQEYFYILGFVFRAQKRVTEASEALAVYQEQLDVLSIG